MDDDELLDIIRHVHAADAPPRRLLENAYESRGWADIDGELAALLEDSADHVRPGVRSDAEARRLVFESGLGVIDLSVDPATGTITGHVDPPSRVEIERRDGTRQPVDDEAVTTFSVSDLDRGPLRLRVQASAGEWVTQSFTI